jgi:hypothetical protein
MTTVTEKLTKENIAKNDIRAKREEMVKNLKSLENQIVQAQQNKLAVIGAIQLCDELLKDEESENVDS